MTERPSSLSGSALFAKSAAVLDADTTRIPTVVAHRRKRVRTVLFVLVMALVGAGVPTVLTLAERGDQPQPATQPVLPENLGWRRDLVYLAALRTHGFEDVDTWTLLRTARDVCDLAGQGWTADSLNGYVWGRHDVSYDNARVWVDVVRRVYCTRSLQLAPTGGGAR